MDQRIFRTGSVQKWIPKIGSKLFKLSLWIFTVDKKSINVLDIQFYNKH